ncbi:MAG: aldehyde dehydrogenase family protein, partial [Bacteroidetes bacterium]
MDKNQILLDLANLIQDNEQEIIRRNKIDLENAVNIDATLVDRLKVDEKKVAAMVQAVQEVISIEDPENKVLSEYVHPNGIKVVNKIVPFGNILIIYESRPDVTIEAAISAFKAGNRIFLKGGKEAVNSNKFLVKLWHEALEKNGADKDYVTYLDLNREATQNLIEKNPHRVDLIIPRGGEGLINYIKSNTNVPLLVSGRGNNFIYIHEDADFDMAVDLILNGKSRLSVCNAIDKVLFNTQIPDLEDMMPSLLNRLEEAGINVLGTNAICEINSSIQLEQDEDVFYEEFLSAKILFSTVNSAEEA